MFKVAKIRNTIKCYFTLYAILFGINHFLTAEIWVISILLKSNWFVDSKFSHIRSKQKIGLISVTSYLVCLCTLEMFTTTIKRRSLSKLSRDLRNVLISLSSILNLISLNFLIGHLIYSCLIHCGFWVFHFI